MFSHTSRTIRLTDIGPDVEERGLVDLAQNISVTRSGYVGRLIRATAGKLPAVDSGTPLTSLAVQLQGKTGTITFSSEELKKKALSYQTSWSIDDVFNDLTVLYSATEPNLDICAVHGLNGNAFDTWAYDHKVMWLRDFLPKDDRFKNSRIMTFGYSSLLRDSSNVSSLTEWSQGLLLGLSSLRKTAAERSRPIIFVCHSLGGLVAREAMVRLHQFPEQYDGLDLRYCGLLFLSTPHSGSTTADWNSYLIELAGHGGIRSKDFTGLLGSFNNESRRSKELFGRIKPLPPFVCLYETRKTKVAGIAKLIVTADSAGLNGQAAQPMNDADHNSICKFPRASGEGYNRVTNFLVSIYEQLPSTDSSATATSLPTTVNASLAPQHVGLTRAGDARGGNAEGFHAQGGGARGGDAEEVGQQNRDVRGGDARGGDARGIGAGEGTARGGDALGGNVFGSGGLFGGNLFAGSALGGDAQGSNARGGDAKGGDAQRRS